MFKQNSPRVGRAASGAALAVVLLFGPATALAQAADGRSGHIDFASVDLPPATVEVDLSQEIFSDLFGLGDAAIAGIVESLTQSNDAQSSKATELAAGQLAAAREIIQLAKQLVREVHVRVYEKLSDEENNALELAARFEKQLTSGQWDSVIKIRDGNDSAHVSFQRVEGSILGVFVVVADGKDVVLANVVCDISPENVKKLTAAATKIGLENGLRDAIERKLRHHAH
ncbi:MAG: DUF4252 domain-containing protein [Planctomycetes bacterium]|nr:DUF4252 domain-containing protein [Planctomycetota bacterium]